jgi:hypothetical protein
MRKLRSRFWGPANFAPVNVAVVIITVLTGADGIAQQSTGYPSESVLQNSTMHLAVIEQSVPELYQEETSIPWAAQVLEIQRALNDLGMYNGPINGRLNAFLEKAIRRFEVKFGQIGRGGLSPNGILNLNAVTQAVRIQRLLEKSRDDQMRNARTALLSGEQTRDLVGGARRWSKGSRDIRYDAHCTPQTMTECSLAQALDEIAKIERADYRDWALRDAVRVIASLGEEKIGREVIGRISDPRLVLVALREMVEGLAGAKKLVAATFIANAIPDIRNKAKALASISVSHFVNGDKLGGQSMLSYMLAVLDEEKNIGNFVSLVTQVARKLKRARLVDVASGLMPVLEARMRVFAGDGKQDAEWGMIATAYATLGDEGGANRAKERIKNADTRKLLILPTSKFLETEATNFEENDVKRSLPRIRKLVVAMNNIALARQVEGDIAGARLVMERSAKYVELLDKTYASDFARAHFVDQALRLNMRRYAYKVTGSINRKALRIKKTWSFVGSGVEDVPIAEAEADTDSISNLFERCATYLHASRVLALKFPRERVDVLMEKARLLTARMSEPWWRARALISLAAAYRENAMIVEN